MTCYRYVSFVPNILIVIVTCKTQRLSPGQRLRWQEDPSTCWSVFEFLLCWGTRRVENFSPPSICNFASDSTASLCPFFVCLDPPGDELCEPGEQLSQLDPLDNLLIVGRKFGRLMEVTIPDDVHPVLADLVQGEAAQQRQEGGNQVPSARAVPHPH